MRTTFVGISFHNRGVKQFFTGSYYQCKKVVFFLGDEIYFLKNSLSQNDGLYYPQDRMSFVLISHSLSYDSHLVIFNLESEIFDQNSRSNYLYRAAQLTAD